ncbi:MAG TPA: hypothetical protein VN089_00975 [Duganella sp.]|nr:hypothetical protein [Duganella sp.]
MGFGTDGQLINGDRGDEPSSWHHTELVPSVTFTWHHTIPWNGLRATWNYLVAGRHWACVEEYLKIISAPHVELTLKALKNAPGIPFAHDEKLLELLTWQGWNIVEGPGNQYRIGDPGEAHERWPTGALTGKQRSTMQAVDLVRMAMERIYSNVHQPHLISATDVEKLEKTFKAMRPLLRGREPIRWTPGMWNAVVEGRVSAKAKGTWYSSPIWERGRG